METVKKASIVVEVSLNAPIERVWKLWTNPEDITKWNFASDDWHSPKAENDLRVGGRFVSRMEAKDGSFGFDFSGIYTLVKLKERIAYTLDDDRKVDIVFSTQGNTTKVIETFEAETENSVELQQFGWQCILNNFKKFVESAHKVEALHFEVSINAKVEKVFNVMIDSKTYSQWTSEFNPTSRYEGSWAKGSKIKFLGTDKDGNIGGMVSRVKENIPNTYISIEHVGIIQKGNEITGGPEVDEWAGALENYSFIENDGKTLVEVEMQSPQEFNSDFKAYFMETWPKALKKLKDICEQ